MKANKMKKMIQLTCAGLISLTLGSVALAGLPQPGLVVYGKVYQSGQELQEGAVEWTYLAGSGQPVTVTAFIVEDEFGSGNEYLYTAIIPAERNLAGFPSRKGAINLTGGQMQFSRNATVNGLPAQIASSTLGETFALNAQQALGFIERVDLLLRTDADCCPGDADGNLVVNLADYRAVRDNFGDASPEFGDADCSGFVNSFDYLAVRDHFGQSCFDARWEPGFLPEVAAFSGADVDLLISSETTSPIVGERLRLRISMDAWREDAALAGIFLQFDPAKVQFTRGFQNSSVFDSALLTSGFSEIQPGLVAFSSGAEVALPTGNFIIADLEFDVLAGGEAVFGFSAFDPYETGILDADFLPMSLSAEQLVLTLGDGVAPVGADLFMIY